MWSVSIARQLIVSENDSNNNHLQTFSYNRYKYLATCTSNHILAHDYKHTSQKLTQSNVQWLWTTVVLWMMMQASLPDVSPSRPCISLLLRLHGFWCIDLLSLPKPLCSRFWYNLVNAKHLQSTVEKDPKRDSCNFSRNAPERSRGMINTLKGDEQLG